MRNFSDTLQRLSRYHRAESTNPVASRLRKLQNQGPNPGNLAGWFHIPETASAPVALVVVLHGCTQTAAGYDAGSGWSKLADDFGFAVLFAEQSRDNNPNLCFNWFVESDIRRDHGEVRSIREMVRTMVSRHGIDPARVFVTGLSAGGAMANAMLAAYPEVFAGGAIIAGLPYGTASTVPEAFDRMRGHGLPSRQLLQDRLRSASSHTSPWPTVSVWHGTADRTVDEVNAQAIVDQWKAVHDIDENHVTSEASDGQEHHSWKTKSGTDAIELYRIKGVGHGTPIDAMSGYGKQSPYMLDVGISSTELIARSWGLTPSFERRARPDGARQMIQKSARDGTATNAIQDVIESALRSAGLMK
jgi:poly(hydroxyalkanoate) depolymerase family esterase